VDCFSGQLVEMGPSSSLVVVVARNLDQRFSVVAVGRFGRATVARVSVKTNRASSLHLGASVANWADWPQLVALSADLRRPVRRSPFLLVASIFFLFFG